MGDHFTYRGLYQEKLTAVLCQYRTGAPVTPNWAPGPDKHKGTEQVSHPIKHVTLYTDIKTNNNQ